MRIILHIWRQRNSNDAGRMVRYEVPDVNPEMSFLEMLDVVNEGLIEAGLEVLLETNGSLPLGGVDARVRRIVDVKCPGSGMSGHNLWANLEVLTPRDEVKFVIDDEDDFTWALDVAQRYRLTGRVPVLISPVFGALSLPEVAAWIVNSGHPVRLNLQLHKYIWGPEARGV